MFENAYFINGTAFAGKSTLAALLAEKYGGILCGENYHDVKLPELDKEQFPNLCYTRDLSDWHDFIRRTPEEYAAWFRGVTLECERVELEILKDLDKQGRRLFVDTNIPVETLRHMAKPGHVLIMLADPEISVSRFFDRPDPEKQFLYRLLTEEPDPAAAAANFRECLRRVNSREAYDAFLHSGFPVLKRDENRSKEETLTLAETIFGLTEAGEARKEE